MTDKIYINPLNYTGAKHKLLPFIKQNLPLCCTTLVDLFGGSGELAINLADNFDNVVYNEINPYLYNIIKTFSNMPSDIFVILVENAIDMYKLSKYNKEGFLECRYDFNNFGYKTFLKNEIEQLKTLRNNLKPKEKQIKDSDIQYIKELRSNGLSYREISKETSWSKATICRVLNGMYD